MLVIHNKKDIIISRGDHRVITPKIKDKSGNVVTFGEGESVYMSVKRSTRDKNPLLRKKMMDGKFTFQSEDTLGIPFGEYVWDLTYYDAAGERQSITPVGKFVVAEVVG